MYYMFDSAIYKRSAIHIFNSGCVILPTLCLATDLCEASDCLLRLATSYYMFDSGIYKRSVIHIFNSGCVILPTLCLATDLCRQ